MVSDGIPPFVVGGMQKHTKLLVEQLAIKGVEVLLYHCVEGALPSEEEVLETFEMASRANINVHTVVYRDDGKLPGHYLRAQRKMADQYFDLIKQESGLDFIYTKGFAGSTILKRRRELKSQCSIGVKFHGMNMFQAQPDWKSELTKFMLRPAVRNIMNLSDVVFSYGGKITDIIRGEVGPTKEIVDIPAGITSNWLRDQDEIKPHGDRPLSFLFVGRYDRVKGLPELYKAIELLSGDHWKLTIVGPIPKAHQFAHPSVTYTGGIYDAKQLQSIFDRHDVLLCPSISEGMPNVILEAMSRGLAIGATDVGATRMLVIDNGKLLAQPKPPLIAKLMNDFIAMDQSQLMAQKRKSHLLVKEQFLWDSIIDKTMRKLVELAS